MNFRKYLAIGASIVFGFIVGCKSIDSKYPVIPGNEITPMSLENALNKSEHTRFLDLKPRFIDDHLKKAVYSYAHNNLEEALAEMNESIKKFPNDDAYVLRGRFYFMKSKLMDEELYDRETLEKELVDKVMLDLAEADFNKAIELNPDNASAFYNRAFVYCKKGDLANAEKDFIKARDLDDNFTRDVNFYLIGLQMIESIYEDAMTITINGETYSEGKKKVIYDAFFKALGGFQVNFDEEEAEKYLGVGWNIPTREKVARRLYFAYAVKDYEDGTFIKSDLTVDKDVFKAVIDKYKEFRAIDHKEGETEPIKDALRTFEFFKK